MNEFMAVIKNYAGFSGRAGRREYWMFFLVYFLIAVALIILASVMPEMLAKVFGFVYLAFVLGLLVPNIAVAVRRLHDTDHSGWWILINLVPFGSFYYLYLVIIEGTSGPNRFGNPVTSIENAV
jgi:uncharacterized membrane protein YhaH (DUF805 family)